MAKRDNFLKWQRDLTYEASAREVKLLWPDDFETFLPHYICAHCRFVSSDAGLFEVDHLVSCNQGGTANRESLERIAQLQAEVGRPLDKQDIGLLMSANFNDQLLCHGCNQGKKSKGMRADEVPAGCGFAYRRSDDDMNPEHRYSGPPKSVGFVEKRYRRS